MLWLASLRSRKSIGKEHTFERDLDDHEDVLSRLETLVDLVMERARSLGVSGRLGEVKIRYTGFETHTSGRSIPVAMDDESVFKRLARQLFATNIRPESRVRLIGFRLGQLKCHLRAKPPSLRKNESGQLVHSGQCGGEFTSIIGT